MNRKDLKAKAVTLRMLGKTYSEICTELGLLVPKGTLSYWFKDLDLPEEAKELLSRQRLKKLQHTRGLALEVNRLARAEYLHSIESKVKHLPALLQQIDIAKIALAMLYLGEGSKTTTLVVFGNSNPLVIRLFLSLLRQCYHVEESKFRCTLQLRADQDSDALVEYWSGITEIPKRLFYKSRFDSRTIGRPTRKSDYKGVCRIDYFSAEIFIELTKISQLICGPVA